MLGKQSLEVAERDVETARAALRGLEAEQEAAQEATHQAQAALQEQLWIFTIRTCFSTLLSSPRSLEAEQAAAQEATHQAQAALQEHVPAYGCLLLSPGCCEGGSICRKLGLPICALHMHGGLGVWKHA